MEHIHTILFSKNYENSYILEEFHSESNSKDSIIQSLLSQVCILKQFTMLNEKNIYYQHYCCIEIDT